MSDAIIYSNIFQWINMQHGIEIYLDGIACTISDAIIFASSIFFYYFYISIKIYFLLYLYYYLNNNLLLFPLYYFVLLSVERAQGAAFLLAMPERECEQPGDTVLQGIQRCLRQAVSREARKIIFFY